MAHDLVGLAAHGGSMTSSAIRIGDGVAMSLHGDIIVLLWKSASRQHRILWLGRQISELTAPLDSYVVLQLILPSSNPPDGAASAEVKRLIKSVEGKMRRLVSVPLGDTMWASIVRSVMRAMVVVTG